jgi:hypothetical protein
VLDIAEGKGWKIDTLPEDILAEVMARVVTIFE